MDFRPNHLSSEERKQPPTFLYAMDLGDGIFFVEETSLACAPPLTSTKLRERLLARLSSRGVEITEVIHEERCLFPMNLPLPDRQQPLLAFGGAASMVHPASGYMVGALLRRAPALARELARSLAVEPALDSQALAKRGWRVLWTPSQVQRHRIFQFGLSRLMGFNEAELRLFFATFFSLPQQDWTGFLANTLSLPKLVRAMIRLSLISSWDIRRGMALGSTHF
jgi:lycopene beta-cyclase